MAYLTLSLFEQQVDNCNYLNKMTLTCDNNLTENLSNNTEACDYEKAIDVLNSLNNGTKTNKSEKNQKKIEHKCMICLKKFTDAFQLERHRKRDIHRRFECNLCSKTYAAKFCLERHMKTAHSNEKYTCDTCGRTFNQKSSIESHLLRHLRDFRFNCAHCPKTFTTKIYLKAHITNMHILSNVQKSTKNQPKYFCSYCNKGFAQKTNAHIHEIRKHEPHKMKYRCFCGMAYATNPSYKEHLKTHLPLEYRPKYICRTCDKTLLSKESLAKHEETHRENRKRVKCTSCCSDFASKLLMKRHMREVHLKIKRKVSCTVL